MVKKGQCTDQVERGTVRWRKTIGTGTGRAVNNRPLEGKEGKAEAHKDTELQGQRVPESTQSRWIQMDCFSNFCRGKKRG
jgi:hypothetical protein